jgi:predicted unusual protein kinase regulating ubiquinone biosynthesis (AarF/ABC1/UbiB family)
VVVPVPVPELCSHRVLTMTYLPGPKIQEEAQRQLAALGIKVTSVKESVTHFNNAL